MLIKRQSTRKLSYRSERGIESMCRGAENARTEWLGGGAGRQAAEAAREVARVKEECARERQRACEEVDAMQAMLKAVQTDCAVQVTAATHAQMEAHATAEAEAAEQIAAYRAQAEETARRVVAEELEAAQVRLTYP
jgi:hypothetical protein